MWKSLSEFYQEAKERQGYNGARGPVRKFTKIPNSILEDPNLTCQEKTTYLVLLRFGQTKGECWPGQGLLAKILKMSERNVRRNLKSLNHKGYLRIEKKGRSNHYFFNKTQ